MRRAATQYGLLSEQYAWWITDEIVEKNCQLGSAVGFRIPICTRSTPFEVTGAK